MTASAAAGGMNIAILCEYTDGRRGGAETSVSEMATLLARAGHRVTLVSAAAPGAAGPSIPGVTSRRIPVRGVTKLARTKHYLAKAEELTRSERFDVVHSVLPCLNCHVYQPRGGTYLETVRRTVGVGSGAAHRLIRRAGRAFNLRQRHLAGLESKLLSRARPPMVAAVSEYVARQVRELARGFPAERLRVVFNGVDIEPLPPDEALRERDRLRRGWGVGGRRSVVLFAAHNFKLKGLRELLHAAAGTRGRAARWMLVVAGRDKIDPYRKWCESLAITEHVRFLGPDVPMRSLYAAADVLAHPTWYDPCSRVVLEATRCGLACVTTSLNGAAEMLKRHSIGAVVETPRDGEKLAEAIEQALAPAQRERLLELSSVLAEELSMQRHVRELLKVYEAARKL